MGIRFGGPGVTAGLGDLTSNLLSLAPGETWLIPANGYMLQMGKYTALQQYDPISGLWRARNNAIGSSLQFIAADGVNVRLANTSGCAVGALLTAVGSGYVTPPTVTASAGGSSWQAIVGGAVNTTVTIATGGTNYQYPPIVVIGAPPTPGVQATGYATVSGGQVTGITITNQGAGYAYPPSIALFNDPRDTTGAGAQAVATLTGAGTVTAVLCTNHGSALTATPTLTFSGGSGSGAAATPIMNYAITGVGVTTAGAGYTAAAGYVKVSATPVQTAGTPAYLNTNTQGDLVRMREATIAVAASSTGALSATGAEIIDGGSYQAAPAAGSVLIEAGTGIVTTAAVLTLTVGGLEDSVYLFPM